MQIIHTDRHYYRCVDCLAIFVVEKHRGKVLCGCGGKCEWMGEVIGQRLAQVKEKCVCDARCTGACGPNCDCPCGGENHGTGLTVSVITNERGIPVASNKPNLEAAKEYRETLKRAQDSVHLRMHQPCRDSEYRAAWGDLLRVEKAVKSRRHANRMKLLVDALKEEAVAC